MVGLCHCWEQTDMKSGSYEKKLLEWKPSILSTWFILVLHVSTNNIALLFIYLFLFYFLLYFVGGGGGGEHLIVMLYLWQVKMFSGLTSNLP